MKKWLLNLLKPFIITQVKKVLSNEEYQKELIGKINARVDIPKIDEAAEEKALNQIYDALQELSIEIVEKI